MDNEELIALIQNGIDPGSNIEKLYLQNKGFIHETARKYVTYAEMDDLMQEGFFALSEAVDRYDPEKGSLFVTYLSYRLHARFRHYIDNCGRMKRLPAYMEERIYKYRSYLSECAAAGKEPADPEICRALKISKEQLKRTRKAMYEADPLSIHDMIPGTDCSIGEGVADPVDVETDIINRVAAEQIKDELWMIVDELGKEQSDVIVNRYQFSKTLKAIGDMYGLSLERIRQIEEKALNTLSRKKRIKELAEDSGIYTTSKAFRGSVGSFINHRTSITEYMAVKAVESDENLSEIRENIDDVREDLQRILTDLNQGS